MKINNVEYGWSQVRISFTGANSVPEESPILMGVTAVNWNKRRETAILHGLGHKGVARGFGNEICEASITMRTSVQIALRGIMNSLLELGEFDVIITFDSEFETEDAIVGNNTVTLKGCILNEDGFDAKQGDMEAEKSFDLTPRDIVYNNNASDGF